MGKWACLIVIIFVLVGCSVTSIFTGKIQGSDEIFTVIGTGNFSGNGTLKAVTNTNVTCKGKFAYDVSSTTKGEGFMTCSDGRTGNFNFETDGKKGKGSGEIGGQKITFSFDQ